MADNSSNIEAALKSGSAEQQAHNQQVFNQSRKSIPASTMKDVKEVETPMPKTGPPDPAGAARARLDPTIKERIEAIQKSRSVYGTAAPSQSMRGPEAQRMELTPMGVAGDGMQHNAMSHNKGPIGDQENNLEH